MESQPPVPMRHVGMYSPNAEQKVRLNRLNRALRRIARDLDAGRIGKRQAVETAMRSMQEVRDERMKMQAAAKIEFDRLSRMVANGWIGEAAHEMSLIYVGLDGGDVEQARAEATPKPSTRRKRRRIDVTREPVFPMTPQVAYDPTASEAIRSDLACLLFIKAARECHGELSAEWQSEFWRRMREQRRERIRHERDKLRAAARANGLSA